jgi:hypothetical protein
VTYDGSNIFGVAVSCVMVLNPAAEQVNAFFGVTGVQSLFGGLRGRVFEVSGVLVAPDPVTLNSYEMTFESYIDGIPRVLIDGFLTAWPNVKLLQFQRQGRVLNGVTVCARPYKALFRSPV